MEDRIIAALRQHELRLTRRELWRQLGLPNGGPTDEYWEAEQALVDQGRIERRRGRNGGIFLIDGPAEQAARRGEVPQQEVAAEIVAEERREAEHYEPALRTLIGHWAEQPGFTRVFGAITAAQGRRRTGGRWSRPRYHIVHSIRMAFFGQTGG